MSAIFNALVIAKDPYIPPPFALDKVIPSFVSIRSITRGVNQNFAEVRKSCNDRSSTLGLLPEITYKSIWSTSGLISHMQLETGTESAENKSKEPLLKESPFHAFVDCKALLSGLSNRGASEPRSEMNQLGRELAKTASLFVPGAAGDLTSAVVYAVDQIDCKASLKETLADLALGASKGVLLHRSLAYLGNSKLNLATKAWGMGILSRGLELGLDRKTFISPISQQYDLSTGAQRIYDASFNNQALALDLVTLGASHAIGMSANRISGGLLAADSRIASTVMGTSLGLTSGSLMELQKQQAKGGSVDYSTVLRSGLLHGIVGGAGAFAGSSAPRLFALNNPASRSMIETASSPESNSLTIQDSLNRVSDQLLRLQPENKIAALKAIPPAEPAQLQGPRLEPKGTLEKTFNTGKPSEIPFTDLSDFRSRGNARETKTMDVYEVPGTQSKVLLESNSRPDYARPSVEQLAAAVEKLPDPSLVKELLVLNHEHPDTPWLQQTAGQRITGEAGANDSVTLFRPTTDAYGRQIAHEWGHQLKNANSDLNPVFDASAKLEKFRSMNDSVPYDLEEPWSILSEHLLAEPPQQALIAGLFNPIRTAVLLKTIESHAALADIQPSSRAGQTIQQLQQLRPTIDSLALERLQSAPLTAEAKRVINFLKM